MPKWSGDLTCRRRRHCRRRRRRHSLSVAAERRDRQSWDCHCHCCCYGSSRAAFLHQRVLESSMLITIDCLKLELVCGGS